MDTMAVYEEIRNHLLSGGAVQITTYLRSTVYKTKHADMFRIGNSGALYVQRGENLDCIGTSNGMLVGVRLLTCSI